MVEGSRYGAAVVGAALAPALLAGGHLVLTSPETQAILSIPEAIGWAGWVFVVALLHAGLLGLPAALIVQRLGWANAFTAIAMGFVIGAVPVGLIIFGAPAPTTAIVGGELIAADGGWTSAGRAGLRRTVLNAGLYGAAGGLAAWLVWCGSVPRRSVWIALAALATATVLLVGQAWLRP